MNGKRDENKCEHQIELAGYKTAKFSVGNVVYVCVCV